MKLAGNQETPETGRRPNNRLFQLDGGSDRIVHNTGQDLEHALRLRPEEVPQNLYNVVASKEEGRNLRSRFAVAESWATKKELSTGYLASV